MRVALYARVSTEEQAKHGLSIDAQLESLRAWAKYNGHTITGEYIDAGISGKKAYKKRPALSRFMSEIEQGLKVDALCFVKLDRFYRSVRLYYQAVEILDRHKVAWIATQEDYETVTSAGRFKVNIMLSIGEAEADRTSERIKAVFDHKIARGECVNPQGLPLGYSCVDKRVVPNDNAPAALAVFQHYAKHGNMRGARDMLQAEYGIALPQLSVKNMLRNRLYIGEYRGNTEYCEPIVSPELFQQVQDDMTRRATKHTPSGRIYLFSGLIICRECGRKMVAGIANGSRVYYRCPNHYMTRTCDNKRVPREYKIENYLVEHLADELRGMEEEYKLRQKEKRRPKSNRQQIEKKLDRLKDLYLNELITLEQYKQDREKLLAQINDDTTPQRQTPAALRIVGDDFAEKYAGMDREHKKTFWRAVLDHLEIDGDGKIYFYFR